jgi:hypothetical protein
MTKATDIAMTPARKLCLALAGLATMAIAACGGGAPTVENPVTNVTPPTTYNGPPPATADVQAFKLNVWDNLQGTNRCGSCHAQGGTGNGYFVRNDDINLAYEAANLVVDLQQPSQSLLVTKVDDPHNCWLADPQACADIMTTWIEGWAGASAGGGRAIVLQPPPDRDPGLSKNYDPSQLNDFANIVHGPYLVQYCSGCHSSQSAASQQPYFAEADVSVAFDAVKPKMNLDEPGDSRLVIRLNPESHNCWQGVSCTQAAAEMQAAIQAFADTITPTQIDPALVNSKALFITDGTIASGGNRYENAQIALWEFKTGSGSKAYDTSGVDPAIDLDLSGDYEWFGGWGITVKGGKAQGTTAASKKLHELIRATGEYSIEAWVVPANVTQEMARIVSYSGGDTTRNFTLQQTLYDYNHLLRTDQTSANGDPALSTPSADEVLQASLQHVVATYDAVIGRSIYVNGQLVTQPDPVPAGSMVDWQDTFALVLGSEVSGDGQFMGTFRLVAIHNRVLTPAQIVQNFDVGVGEKFYLLFGIEDIINVPTAYILFEVAQYDSWGYLFTQPHFVTLDGSQQASGIPIQGMRIGLNGAEAPVGQSYGNIDDMLDTALFAELGQPLSALGAVVPLEKGPSDDEFFLTFDQLGAFSYVRTDDPPLVITASDLPQAERIGVRTFDEINATFAEVTTVDPTTPSVDIVFQDLRQSLPAVPEIMTFLSSHQVAIAQLAIQYCDALIEDGAKASAYFPGFNFAAAPATAFGGANRDLLIDPLIDRVMNIGVMTQPDFVDVKDELGYAAPVALGRPDNLIDRLLNSPTVPAPDTRAISKAVCASVVGSAVTLVK